MVIIQNLVDIELNLLVVRYIYIQVKVFVCLHATVFGCPTFQVTSTSLLPVPFNDDLFVSVPSSLGFFFILFK